MFKIGIFAIILDDNKSILICHRRDYNLWNLPGGGLNEKETPEQGIIREVREETGLDIAVEKITGLYVKDIKNELVISFLCNITGGKMELTDEADEIKHVALQDIPNNFPPKQLERIKDYFENPQKTYYKIQSGKSTIELLKEGKL